MPHYPSFPVPFKNTGTFENSEAFENTAPLKNSGPYKNTEQFKNTVPLHGANLPFDSPEVFESNLRVESQERNSREHFQELPSRIIQVPFREDFPNYGNMKAELKPEGRLSLADWESYSLRDHEGPGTYAFGFDVEDPETNNIQTRNEERYPNGTVVGSYGYVQPDGSVVLVNYVADENGYRANVETNPRGQLKPVKINDNLDFGEFGLENSRDNSGKSDYYRSGGTRLYRKEQGREEDTLQNYVIDNGAAFRFLIPNQG